MKKYLAVDIDDTLAETAKTVMELLHQSFGDDTSSSPESLLKNHRQPSDVKIWQTEEARSFVTQLLHSEKFLLSLSPIHKSQETLQVLAQNGADIWYITSRLETFQNVTQLWLEKNMFPKGKLTCRSIHEQRHNWKLHTLSKNVAFGSSESVFIDDTVEAFSPIPPTYQGSFVLLNRWQQVSFVPNGTVCTSWPEIYNHLS